MKEYKLIANYHAHTTRCMHACGEDREYVEAAIENGLQILGFSDHTPYPTGTDYVSGMRMPLHEAEDYFASITRLKKEYEKDITIYAGVEAEYFPEHFDKLLDFMKDYPLDYMILGNHFVPDEENGIYVGCAFKDYKYLKEYGDNVVAAIKSGKFAYIAHPDLPLYVGKNNEELTKEVFHKICKTAKEYQIPLEINMLGWVRKVQYPSDRFFEIAGEYGNDVIIGMDIHNPKDFGNMNAVLECKKLADKYKLNLLDKIDITGKV